jgi:hypothetical protein
VRFPEIRITTDLQIFFFEYGLGLLKSEVEGALQILIKRNYCRYLPQESTSRTGQISEPQNRNKPSVF